MTSYVARRTPVHQGPAAWRAILPVHDAPMELAENCTVDFAIIGAGFAGLAAARRIRQTLPKARIGILEAGVIAEGATGRNSGFMIDLPHELAAHDYAGGVSSDRAMIALNRQAINFATSAVEDYDIPPAYFDRAGKINGAASVKTDGLNRSYAHHLTALGEVSERLDAQSMHDVTGSRHYVSGLFTPGTIMLQPAGFVQGMARGLRRSGVRIFENAGVLKFEKDGSHWRLHTAQHVVTAGKIILATNGHLESFGFARQRLMHIFLYASMTVELDATTLQKQGGAPRWGVTPSNPMGTTMRRIDSAQGGNRIITRTCASFLPGMEASAADLKRSARVHRQKFSQRFPQLADVPMEYTWAGHLCLSRNGVAVMRELDTNVFSACVQNGLGTTRGTLTGIGAADLACGATSAIAQHFMAEADPTRLPPPPLSTLGANVALRWKEWRATKE
jgi:glycine/D-amino acid oxidase-like deaminating enzyme